MTTRVFIHILVLLIMLSGNTGAQEFASTQTALSQHGLFHWHKLHHGFAHKREMCFGSRVGGDLFLVSFLTLDYDGQYSDNTLTNRQQAVAITIAGYCLAGVAVGILLLHFGQRHERNHPEKFQLVSNRKQSKLIRHTYR